MMTLTRLREPHEWVTSLDALEMVEAAGSCLAPAIPDGARLFVDPAMVPRHGDYVLLKMPHIIEGSGIDEAVKQFQIHTKPTGEQIRLICNSAGRFRLVEEKILGVVVAFTVEPGHRSELGSLVDAAHAAMIERIKARSAEVRG